MNFFSPHPVRMSKWGGHWNVGNMCIKILGIILEIRICSRAPLLFTERSGQCRGSFKFVSFEPHELPGWANEIPTQKNPPNKTHLKVGFFGFFQKMMFFHIFQLKMDSSTNIRQFVVVFRPLYVNIHCLYTTFLHF